MWNKRAGHADVARIVVLKLGPHPNINTAADKQLTCDNPSCVACILQSVMRTVYVLYCTQHRLCLCLHLTALATDALAPSSPYQLDMLSSLDRPPRKQTLMTTRSARETRKFGDKNTYFFAISTRHFANHK